MSTIYKLVGIDGIDQKQATTEKISKIRISLTVSGVKVRKQHNYTPKALTIACHKTLEVKKYLSAVLMAAKVTIELQVKARFTNSPNVTEPNGISGNEIFFERF